MKLKKLVFPILCAILMIVIICFIPSINKGRQISNYQSQLKVLAIERSKCEVVQKTNHEQADAIRVKLWKLVGVPFIQEQEMPQRTWTIEETLNNYIWITLSGNH